MGEINCYNFVKILVKVFHVRAKQDSSKHILFILNSIRKCAWSLFIPCRQEKASFICPRECVATVEEGCYGHF